MAVLGRSFVDEPLAEPLTHWLVERVGDNARVEVPHSTLRVVRDVNVTEAAGRDPLEGCKLNDGTDVGWDKTGPFLVVFVLDVGGMIEDVVDVLCMEEDEERVVEGGGARATASVMEDDGAGDTLDVELEDTGAPGMKTAGVDAKRLLLPMLLPGISVNADDDAKDVVDNERDTSGVCEGGCDGTDGLDTSAVLLTSTLEDDAKVGGLACELCDSVDGEVVVDVTPLPTAVVDALVEALVDALDTTVSKVDALLEGRPVLEDRGRLTTVVAVTISLTVTMAVALLCRRTLLQRFSRRAPGGPTAQCHGKTSMPETCHKQ